VRIIQILTKTEPHRENLKDDYDKVAQKALEEKKNNALEKWFGQKIPTFYVDIAEDFKACPEMQKWTASSTAQK